MKNELIKSLLYITKEMAGVYEGLVQLLKKERLSLANNTLEKLIECVKKKETLTLKLKMLEESREELVCKIAENSGVRRADITMSYLSNKVAEPYSSELLKVQSTLALLLKTIRGLNKENEMFIERSMEGIRSSFDFFNNITAFKNTYHNAGGVKVTGQSGRMVCQQV